MNGKAIVKQWREHYGTMAGLAADIDVALAAERNACIAALCPYCRDKWRLVTTWSHAGCEYELYLHTNGTEARLCLAAAIHRDCPGVRAVTGS